MVGRRDWLSRFFLAYVRKKKGTRSLVLFRDFVLLQSLDYFQLRVHVVEYVQHVIYLTQCEHLTQTVAVAYLLLLFKLRLELNEPFHKFLLDADEKLGIVAGSHSEAEYQVDEVLDANML